jgi:histidinol-phosphate aminotransferase
VYRPPRSPRPIDLHLDGNEGIDPDPGILEVLAREGSAAVRRYPRAASLRERIAARWGVPVERVAVTAGVDDALDRITRAVIAPGRAAAVPLPTFEMIERYVRLAGGTVRPVEWRDGAYPEERVLAACDETTALAFVVTPNNPTGAVATAAQIRRMAAARPGVLFAVDLAYVDFADEDPTPELLELPNVAVLRTLSKAWGLAGLRVGFALASEEVVEWMARVGQPYAVSGPSLALAEWWWDRGEAPVREWVQGLRDERERLASTIARLGGRPVPSQANFVLARFDDPAWVKDGLEGLGIAVRAWPGREGLEDALRITLPGDDARFERLLEGLRAVLAPEALLLDMDGVLADVSGSHREAVARTAERFGVAVSPGEIGAAKRRGGANNDWELTRRLIAAAGVEVSLVEVTRVFEELYHGAPGRPGLRERERPLIDRDGLERLKRGRPLAIVTGRPGDDAWRFLRRFGLDGAVDLLVGLEDAPGKPAPDPVLAALRGLGVRRAWMVGDTVDDVRAARRAGVVPIGVLPPGDEPGASEEALIGAGASRVLRRLDELTALEEKTR